MERTAKTRNNFTHELTRILTKVRRGKILQEETEITEKKGKKEFLPLINANLKDNARWRATSFARFRHPGRW
jgi:hypothetical protein